ncbi:MAG TPA: baseplate J/gp47 family protein [Anaeromyxobacteraceae bacterium]|nr:baseplate J/gp47 family protein [Anaeromyxobacteraceae bacterium]
MGLTYAQATAVAAVLDIEAGILADVAGQGADYTGYDEFSLAKALINEQARARNAEQAVRVTLAKTIDPTALASLDPSWVDVVLMGRYQTPRNPAIATVGNLVVNVASGRGPYTYSAGDLLIQDTITGAFFRSSNSAPQAASSSSPATIAFTAQTPGAASNPVGAPAFKLITAPPGSSLGLSFGAWTRTTAGTDQESNLAYVQRAFSRWGTLGYGGNIDAYNYWIPTSTPTVTRWWVDDANPGGPGTVFVYLADSAGPATTGEVASVQAYITPRVALGTAQFLAQACSQTTVPVAAISTADGSNPSYLANQGAALALLQAAAPIGALLDLSVFYELLRGAPVATIDFQTAGGGSKVVQINAPGFGGVTSVALSAPAAPVVLSANAIAAFSASLS